MGDSLSYDDFGFKPADSLPEKINFSGGDPNQAGDALQDPAPLAPINATISPASISMVISLKAWMFP
jgi:hypothetical protein